MATKKSFFSIRAGFAPAGFKRGKADFGGRFFPAELVKIRRRAIIDGDKNFRAERRFPMLRNIRAVFKLTALLVSTLLMLPWAMLSHALARDRLHCGRWWTRAWSALALRLLGGRVELVGEALPEGGGMLVGNHQSYLDIMVHGALFGARFAPKVEMSKWPIVGAMTGLTNPVWVDRRHRSLSGGARDGMCEALDGDVPLLIYPEGTNSDGSGLLPFKTTCFDAAVKTGCSVRPVVTCYLPSADGTRLQWCDHTKMMVHFWRVLGLKGFSCRVYIMPEVRPDGRGRKEFAEHLHRMMSECFDKLNGAA